MKMSNLIYIAVDKDNVPMAAYRSVEAAQEFVTNFDNMAVGYDAIPFNSESNTIFLVLDKDNIALAVFDNEDDAADFDDETEVSEGVWQLELL